MKVRGRRREGHGLCRTTSRSKPYVRERLVRSRFLNHRVGGFLLNGHAVFEDTTRRLSSEGRTEGGL